jgi:hypothetical protein
LGSIQRIDPRPVSPGLRLGGAAVPAMSHAVCLRSGTEDSPIVGALAITGFQFEEVEVA